MIRRIGKAISILLTIVLAVLLAGNLYIAASKKITGNIQPTVFGWACAVVISGSMQPQIRVNDMVVFHAQKDYAVDDVIVFQTKDELVTHRVIEKTPEGFITKGDYNNAPDAEVVSRESVIGKVVLVIPAIGATAEFAQTPLGTLLLLIALFILIAWPTLVGRPEETADSEDEQ